MNQKVFESCSFGSGLVGKLAGTSHGTFFFEKRLEDRANFPCKRSCLKIAPFRNEKHSLSKHDTELWLCAVGSGSTELAVQGVHADAPLFVSLSCVFSVFFGNKIKKIKIFGDNTLKIIKHHQTSDPR